MGKEKCDHIYLPAGITTDGTRYDFFNADDVEETDDGFVILKCQECGKIVFQSIAHNWQIVWNNCQ
jgi:hypothetical protein